MKRPLKVVHVTLGLEVGGQEKLLVEMARHADRSRFDLHVVSLTGAAPLPPTLRRAGGRSPLWKRPTGCGLASSRR